MNERSPEDVERTIRHVEDSVRKEISRFATRIGDLCRAGLYGNVPMRLDSIEQAALIWLGQCFSRCSKHPLEDMRNARTEERRVMVEVVETFERLSSLVGEIDQRRKGR
jgi:hypothetical protein